jgi:hypothetical protein
MAEIETALRYRSELEGEEFELVGTLCELLYEFVAEVVEGGTVALQLPPQVAASRGKYRLNLWCAQAPGCEKRVQDSPKMLASSRENPLGPRTDSSWRKSGTY